MWLSLKRSASLRVRYVDETGTSDEFYAVPGRTTFEIENSEGLIEAYRTSDFIFPVEDLQIAGVATLPKRTGVIERLDDDDNVTARHELNLPAGADGKHYRYVDQYDQLIRCHTVKLKD